MLDTEIRAEDSCDQDALMIHEEYELGDWLDNCKGEPVEARAMSGRERPFRA